MATDHVYLPCTLSRGGFSHERFFAIETPVGSVTGIAHIRYCRTADGERPRDEEWVPDHRESGFVAVRVIRPKNGSGNTWVQTPDGEVAAIPTDLVERNTPEGTARVPVESGH